MYLVVVPSSFFFFSFFFFLPSPFPFLFSFLASPGSKIPQPSISNICRFGQMSNTLGRARTLDHEAIRRNSVIYLVWSNVRGLARRPGTLDNAGIVLGPRSKSWWTLNVRTDNTHGGKHQHENSKRTREWKIERRTSNKTSSSIEQRSMVLYRGKSKKIFPPRSPAQLAKANHNHHSLASV